RTQRWAYNLAKNFRGEATCPSGTYRNTSVFGQHCTEAFVLNGEQHWNVFGPFSTDLVDRCVNQAQGGTACYSVRWSATLYMGLTGQDAPFPGTEPPSASYPYYSQVDNYRDGVRSCNVTSIAMALDYYGVTSPATLGQRTPDYLLQRFGVEFTPGGLRWIFDTVAAEQGSPIRDRLDIAASIEDLRYYASRGIPTVVHGWFTPDGHIIMVTGYDGEYYTVNDPYGRWNLQWMGSYSNTISGSGNQVRYPRAAFEDAVATDTAGNYLPLWLHIFE
ncbi:MAG: C39 family peptidase, partial [Myxococcota bacterium]